MKAIRLLLLMIVDAALLSGGLYAVPTNPAADQAASESAPKAVSAQSNRPSGDGRPQSAAASGEQQGPRRSDKNRPRIEALATKPTRPRPIARQRTLSEAGNPANLPSPAPSQSTLVNHGSIQNEAIYRALPVRPGGTIRPVAPSAGNVRHRDPNPPVIGGAASSNSRSAAVIDGTRTKLKGPRN